MKGNTIVDKIGKAKAVPEAKLKHWRNIYPVRAKARNTKWFKASIKWNIINI